MKLEQQEEFLKSEGWGWLLEALAFNREHLSNQQSKSPDRDGIVTAKRDDYAATFRAVTEHARISRKAP